MGITDSLIKLGKNQEFNITAMTGGIKLLAYQLSLKRVS